MSEHSEQVMVFQWAALNEARYPELKLLHAIPNWAGVKAGTEKARMIEGGRRKREGIRAGVPDIHLPVARGGFHSLYVEMKTTRRIALRGGFRYEPTKPTAAQSEWHLMLRKARNAVAVCTDAGSAQAAIENYLRLDEIREVTP